MSAMQSVPRGLAASIPLSQKYDHVTAFDTLDLTTSAGGGSTAKCLYLDATTPWSPLHEGTASAAQVTGSRNATFSVSMRDLYNKCVVLNSEIRVDFFHSGASGAGAQTFVGITPLAVTDIDHGAISIANGPWDAEEPTNNRAFERYGTVYSPLRAFQTKTLITSMAPHKFMGRTDPLGDTDYHVLSEDNGTCAADSARAFWCIWVALVQNTPMVSTKLCDIVITERKTIVWFEPKDHTRTSN